MLREINLGCSTQGHPNQKINSETYCVAELYCSFLKTYNTGKVVKCNINIRDNWDDLINYYQKHTDVITIRNHFDFIKYVTLNNEEKKKMQLEAIHKGMMQIAEKENWEINPLLDAYNSCLKANLEFKFFINDKFKTSPNKQHSIGFWCEWDIDFCKVFWVLRDKNKTEIKRQILTNEKPYDGEFVYYFDWKWLNDLTVEVSDKYKYGKNLKWEIEL